MLCPCAKNRNSRPNKAACDRFPSIQTTTARSKFGVEQLKVDRDIDSLSSTYASLSHVHRPSVLVDAIAPSVNRDRLETGALGGQVIWSRGSKNIIASIDPAQSRHERGRSSRPTRHDGDRSKRVHGLSMLIESCPS